MKKVLIKWFEKSQILAPQCVLSQEHLDNVVWNRIQIEKKGLDIRK